MATALRRLALGSLLVLVTACSKDVDASSPDTIAVGVYIARYWSADVRDVAVLAGFLVVLYLRAAPRTNRLRSLSRRRLPMEAQ